MCICVCIYIIIYERLQNMFKLESNSSRYPTDRHLQDLQESSVPRQPRAVRSWGHHVLWPTAVLMRGLSSCHRWIVTFLALSKKRTPKRTLRSKKVEWYHSWQTQKPGEVSESCQSIPRSFCFLWCFPNVADSHLWLWPAEVVPRETCRVLDHPRRPGSSVDRWVCPKKNLSRGYHGYTDTNIDDIWWEFYGNLRFHFPRPHPMNGCCMFLHAVSAVSVYQQTLFQISKSFKCQWVAVIDTDSFHLPLSPFQFITYHNLIT